MHIVYISREYVPTLRGGGIASYVKDMAAAMVKMKNQVTVVCASDDTRQKSDETIKGVRVIRLEGGDFSIPAIEGHSFLKKLRSVFRFYSYRKKVRETIKNLKNVDVIEVAEYGAESLFLNDLGIPVVIRLHTPSNLDRKTAGMKKYKIYQFGEYWQAKQEKKILKKNSYITSCSGALGDWVVQYYGISSECITTIYNPVHTKEWESIHDLNKKNAILFVGTVAEEKGVGDLIEACRLLHIKNKSITLTIAGKQGEYGQELQKRVLDKGFTWCHFLGNVPREELKELYNHHTLAVFPSWWDNMPLVCLEAMASGIPVLGSSSGGMSEIIKDRENGFLIAPGNAVFLAKHMEYILSLSAEFLEQLTQKAKSEIKNRFCTEIIIRKTLNYYSNVINTNQNIL